jgi:ERCC4-type nuclease
MRRRHGIDTSRTRLGESRLPGMWSRSAGEGDSMKLPAKLDPSAVTAIVDTREQTPLDLAPLRVQAGTLSTGDYALAGCDSVRIERKSLEDLLACVGRERDRFDREIERLRAFEVAVLLVESTWGEIELGQWRGKITPAQVEGSLLGWAAKGIQVELVGTHERAGRFASRLLYTVARRRYRELRTFADGVAL